MSKNGKKDKLLLMQIARQSGWKGKSYRAAKKFERKMNWKARNERDEAVQSVVDGSINTTGMGA